jgi:hypothetical protein
VTSLPEGLSREEEERLRQQIEEAMSTVPCFACGHDLASHIYKRICIGWKSTTDWSICDCTAFRRSKPGPD